MFSLVVINFFFSVVYKCRNCYLPHLFKYLMAKVLGACIRRLIFLSGEHPADEDLRDLQSKLSGQGIWTNDKFIMYAHTVWALLLSELGINAGTREFEAGFYFLYKPLHSSVSTDAAIAPNTTCSSINSSSSVGPSEEHIDTAALEGERCRLLSESSTGLTDASTQCILTEAWDEASAGELLRFFFQTLAATASGSTDGTSSSVVIGTY
jgi:hypothetical protein